MNTIEFQKNQFKIREVVLPLLGSVLISTTTLNQLLLNNNGSYTSDEAIYIDESIYYFVDELEIKLSDEKLISLIANEVK